MKAAAQAQRTLLDLQGLDTAIAQLDHQRATLPETVRARALQAERARAAEAVIAAETIVSDLELEQAKAESDLVPVRERRARNRTRIDDGSVSDPKSLRALVEETEHLGRRIGELEDAELEVMERLEEARMVAERAGEKKSAIEDVMRTVLAEREAKLTAIAGERGQREAERDAVAAAVPADLLALYERLAAKSGGVGAAMLRHGRCSGCQLEANGADLARYKAAAEDEVLRCEECGRILVRTAESGL